MYLPVLPRSEKNKLLAIVRGRPAEEVKDLIQELTFDVTGLGVETNRLDKSQHLVRRKLVYLRRLLANRVKGLMHRRQGEFVRYNLRGILRLRQIPAELETTELGLLNKYNQVARKYFFCVGGPYGSIGPVFSRFKHLPVTRSQRHVLCTSHLPTMLVLLHAGLKLVEVHAWFTARKRYTPPGHKDFKILWLVRSLNERPLADFPEVIDFSAGVTEGAGKNKKGQPKVHPGGEPVCGGEEGSSPGGAGGHLQRGAGGAACPVAAAGGGEETGGDATEGQEVCPSAMNYEK